MSLSSQLTRYRPAVLALTGIAAGYGIWALWSASTPSQPTLHRSNAIRRPRRQANSNERIRVFTGPEDEQHPLGCITYQRSDEQVYSFRIGLEPLPTAQFLRETFNCNGAGLRNTIASQAVWCILAAASISQSAMMPPDRRTALIDLGIPLDDIVAASTQQDPTALERSLTQISVLLGFVDAQLILDNFQQFPNSSSYMLSDHVTLELNNNPDLDIAETEQYQTEPYQTDPNGDNKAEPSHGLKGLLFFVAEEQAKREAYEHRGITCEGCHESPIKNVRWHCLNCPDFDLCSTCEAAHNHDKTHLFVKIKTPIPALAQPSEPLPVWYPGEPHLTPDNLSADSRRRLREAYKLDNPHLDALYDQFACIASVECHDDPSGVNVAIGRNAFDKALSSDQWTNPNSPNVIYDRMFAFYDSDGKGLILFDDFVAGITYLRGPERFKSLDRALKGYDFDNDGFVNRSDCLRLLRAKYALTKNITSTAALLREADKSYLATEVLESSQPISSLFSDEPIPHGGPGSRRGKQLNTVGDMEPRDGVKTVLDDGDDVSVEPAESQSRPGDVSWRDVSLSALSDALQGTHRTTTDVQPGARADSKADSFTDEEAALLGLTGSRSRPRDQTAPDMMWRIVEEGLHELLDPMFKITELLDQDVLNTKDERQKWRAQIDEVVKERERREESLKLGAEHDPLMATALDSYVQNARPAPEDNAQSRQQDVVAHFREGMVPTDPDSLNRLESEIHSQPLENLLSAAGYSVADNEEPPTASQTTDQSTSATVDPTLPHNRPNDESSNDRAASLPESMPEQPNPDAPPSHERLEHLAQLDHEEKRINTRGGPGRLSFDEIEAIVTADDSEQLKGLMISWLEWASF